VTVELVIFDCDGVLVDSEPIANRVFAQALAELGLHLTDAQMFDYFLGRSMDDCMNVVAQLLGRAPPENFLSDLQRRTFGVFASELHATPCIEYALDRIAVPCCVASSGDHDKMRTTLGITGLLPRFEGRLFSVTQVAHAKPAPDVYLYAARQFDANPQNCIVVEDTPAGVRAGAAAQMTVFGFCAHTPAATLSDAGAHRTFEDMRMLPQMIASRT
jgi:HAD superfamily hydrolase (TIGR01509 family)